MFEKTNFKKFLKNSAWNTWCFVSVVGIWPRYIEPKLLSTSRISISIKDLPRGLEGLKILQFSDLHLNSSVSDRYISKLIRTIEKASPDIIVFTGDFINYSQLEEPKRFHHFLSALEAPYGCYAILGNHDYAEPISINESGEYDVLSQKKGSSILRGIKRILMKPHLAKKVTDKARNVPYHEELVSVINQTPFKLLHNDTKIIPIKDTCLNICGLGEYMLGKALPDVAFKNYDHRYPGIVLAHNPDSLPLLKDCPGDLVLCGHTHGAQVNIPWIRSRITLLENDQYLRGLYNAYGRWVYINRGVGAALAFRWFARPEVALFTLKSE